MMRKRWIVALGLCLLLRSALSEAQQKQFVTPGGPLVIQQLDKQLLGSNFVVMLGGREVMRTQEGDVNAKFPDFPVPRVLAYAGKGMPPFAAVAVFQQFNWGNACNGGPLWFLGIYKDGSFWTSKPIEFCGGTPPIVSITSKIIRVTLPGSDKKGSTPTPKREWILFQGKVRQLR